MNQMEKIYAAHMRTVYGFFMVKTMDHQIAEDLTSEVFTKTWEQLQNPQHHILNPEKYLYGVMKLTWTQYLRNKYQKPMLYVDNIEEFEPYVQQSIQDFKSKTLAERARPYIEQLPEKQRQVMVKRFIDGASLKDICDQLGKDMNYVKTTQRRGLAALRKMIASEKIGVTYEN